MLPLKTLIITELIILVTVAVVSARLDAGIWKRKGITRAGHLKRAVGRGIFIAVQAHAAFSVFFSFILFWLLQACVWWLVFDISINLFKGKEPFYVGRTAFLDRIFWKFTGEARGAAVYQLVAKLSILIFSIIMLWKNHAN